jgi:hypothetical protein
MSVRVCVCSYDGRIAQHSTERTYYRALARNGTTTWRLKMDVAVAVAVAVTSKNDLWHPFDNHT